MVTTNLHKVECIRNPKMLTQQYVLSVTVLLTTTCCAALFLKFDRTFEVSFTNPLVNDVKTPASSRQERVERPFPTKFVRSYGLIRCL